MARESKFTEELWDEILRRLGEGEPLAQICRDANMPHRSVVHDWKNADKVRQKQFDDARDDGFDLLAAQALKIIDTPCPGVIEELERQPKVGGAEGETELVIVKLRREDMLGHRKLQFEGRLKLLKCWDPRRYGDKMDLNVDATVRGSVSYRANLPPRKPPTD